VPLPHAGPLPAMNTIAQLSAVIDGRVHSPESDASGAEVALGRIVTDSRQVEPGDVFWALRGRRHDGAEFVGEAFRRGAVVAVVARTVEIPDGHWVIQVADTHEALRRLVRWKRGRFTGTVIGVTGSSGKTTTRQMIHTVLRARLRGTASPRNYNNELGLPLSMLAIEPEHDYAVLELGASRPGEIASLAGLCGPKVGVITCVGDAHLGGFGSREAIAQTKAELLAALPPDGRAVLGDDPFLRRLTAHCRAPIEWVGTGSECHLRASHVETRPGELRFQIGDCRFCVPVWGAHHLTAALAAVAVGRMMGFDLDEMADLLEDFQPLPMRCEVREIRGATVINDAYNANPTAMHAALELLAEFDAAGRRVVVAGDMAELGYQSARLHYQVGQKIVQTAGADLLIACGRFGRFVVSGARSAGMPAGRAIACESVDEALPYLGQAVQPGDVVLVKGSRMMAMERVVEALEQYPRRRSA